RPLLSDAEAQTKIHASAQSNPAADLHPPNKSWEHLGTSTQTTLKLSALPLVPRVAADKTATTTRRPGRHKSSPGPRDAPAPQFRAPDPSMISTARTVLGQCALPLEIVPSLQPGPTSQHSAAARSAREKTGAERASMLSLQV